MADREELDQDALTAAHLAVEDRLIEMRDSRMFMIAANGLVVNERDGSLSSVKRMSTRMGLEIGIRAYLNAVSEDPGAKEADR